MGMGTGDGGYGLTLARPLLVRGPSLVSAFSSLDPALSSPYSVPERALPSSLVLQR